VRVRHRASPSTRWRPSSSKRPDYLTKPVKRERLARRSRVARARAARARGARRTPCGGQRARPVARAAAEVLYLKAELKYVTLRTTGRTLGARRRA
jgi:two-component system response regulator AlgR